MFLCATVPNKCQSSSFALYIYQHACEQQCCIDMYIRSHVFFHVLQTSILYIYIYENETLLKRNAFICKYYAGNEAFFQKAFDEGEVIVVKHGERLYYSTFKLDISKTSEKLEDAQ